MGWAAVNSNARLLSHAAGVALRHAILRLEAGPFARWRWPGPMPDRLVIAPQDIRTADPTLASDIYAGVFAFDSKVMETGGRSPFELPLPSATFARDLHGFGWLRHLRAADSALTRQNARALVADWISQEPRAPREAYDVEVLARRILAWITQSPLILETADRAFYRRFLKSLVRQVRRLRLLQVHAADGYPRLFAAMAIAEAALSMDGQQRLIRQATLRLDQELERQILADGGHISRDPGVILELLTDLLPLRQAYTARGIAPSAKLLSAVDRMMPMLRFFRHVDGAFGHFNGMGSTPADQLATVLAYDDSLGRPVRNATFSGYQRIEATGTTILMDTGPAPPIGVSQRAHAGCLSFEMSSGQQRFIVNCGSSSEDRWQAVARSTAAHSTLVLEDRSSARFVTSALIRNRLGPVMFDGPRDVPVTREDRADGSQVVARHGGYERRFGLQHERRMMLAADGGTIVGVDRLIAVEARTGEQDRFTIRFHLHPAIRANRTAGGDVLLVAPDGEAWTFSCPMSPPEIEEGIYLSDIYGRRRSSQLVISGRARIMPEVNWTMVRTGAGHRGRAVRSRGGPARGDLFDQG